jgi:hypothetical protein
MFRSFLRLFVLCVIFTGAARMSAQVGSANMAEEKTRGALERWLEPKLQTSQIKITPKIVPIETKSVRQIFPDDTLYGVYFPRWPRVIPPPEGLSSETIVQIRGQDFLVAIRNEDELKTFLAKAFGNVTNEPVARTSVEASLDLAACASADGPYKLKPPEFSIVREDNGITANAVAAVLEPDRGEISVTIHFNTAGTTNPDLIKIASSARLGSPPR